VSADIKVCAGGLVMTDDCGTRESVGLPPLLVELESCPLSVA
jgi:hypothetical protein